METHAVGPVQRVASVPEMKACDSVAALDVDADALADILCTNGNSGTVARNETPLPWIRHVLATGFRNQSAAPGDFRKATEYTTLSLEGMGDPRPILDLSDGEGKPSATRAARPTGRRSD